MIVKNEEYHPEDTFDSLSTLLTWVRPLVKHLEYPTARMEGLASPSHPLLGEEIMYLNYS